MTQAPVLITPKSKDLGDGFMVRRVLPAIERRNLGPFIFLDEMGPVPFAPGQGLDVRPHPHIGLSTVTYLFEGEIEHRDSLGITQVIRPGDVNLMTAGRGIVHSERSPKPRNGGRVHGIQFWAALPAALEESAPSFEHTPGAMLPRWGGDGAALTLIMGTFRGETSPVTQHHPAFYLDAILDAGASFEAARPAAELGLYCAIGEAAVNGFRVAAGSLAVLDTMDTLQLEAVGAPCRFILFGGAALDGPRKLWWNFVSSRPERIEQAKKDWQADAMGQVPGEGERIPLPTP
jgi:redox-sensitive bicupin YhaK (pirin superfamily)